jgi:5-methylcytosine-specific restriction protein A
MPTRPPTHRAHGVSHGKAAKAEASKAHDERRGSSTARGYGSRWQRARLVYLDDHPLCCWCERQGKIEPATVVDHIKAHRGDPQLFWSQDNWQPLCKPHHDRHKQRQDRELKLSPNVVSPD